MNNPFFPVLLSLLMCLILPLAATAQAVDIPDPKLRTKIESVLGKASGATIIAADMAKLTRLEARNASITDLTGLQHATNLTELYLGGEWVEAEKSWKASNSVSNLSPLAGLTNLAWLDLRENNISDLSALAGLTNLTWLDLRENNILDLSPLAGLTNLTWLNLEFTSISDLSPLTGLTSLTDLLLFGNDISDLSPLAGLTNLKRLGLARNNLSSISPLASLTNLKRLGLAQNNLSNISALASLTNLATLGLAYNDISDISPLAGLINLTRLGLRHNRISDISPVAGLTNLTFLHLTNNYVTDLSSLSGLTNLTELRLENNWISGLSPLVANTGLGSGDMVHVRGNRLRAQSLHTHIPALQSRGVTVEFDNRPPPPPINTNGMVRVVYFLPSDRPARPGRVVALRQSIKNAQQFFADAMDRHGFDRKTFTVETDEHGEPVVHHIDGKFTEDYYNKSDKTVEDPVWEEIVEHFDDFHHIYFIAMDVSREILGQDACGLGGNTFFTSDSTHYGFAGGFALRSSNITQGEEVLGGWILIPVSGHCFGDGTWRDGTLQYWGATLHELGHAFGLGHDYREGISGDSVMASPWTTRLSRCAAEWLSVSRFFNTKSVFRNEPGEIQLLSRPTYSRDVIRLRFKVTDPDGLHQVQLLSNRLIDCKRLNGKTSTVEFVASIAERINRITLQIIDVGGNITWATFPIQLDVVVSTQDVLDVNGDGAVNILDLTPVASHFGQRGKNPADVNEDRVVDIVDLLMVAGGSSALPQQAVETFTAGDVQKWLTDAKQLDIENETLKNGIVLLEHLLTEITLLREPMEVATGSLKAIFVGHTGNVSSVAFSPDGGTLASASLDGTIRLWDLNTAQHKNILIGHTSSVHSVMFSPDGQTLASGSWDGTIRLWNPNTGKLKTTLTDHINGVTSVMFSPDGQTLVSGSADKTVRLWNTNTWQVERTLTGHTLVVDSVAFSPDGAMLASGSRDKTIRLWNRHTGQHVRTLTGHTSDILSMMFSPDGGTLASGGLDGTIRLWNPNTGKLKRALPNQGGWVNSVAFSPDGGTLAIGKRGIALWDTNTEEYKRPLIEDIGNAVSVVFSPDGQTVASGSADNLVRLLESTPPEVPFATTPFDVTNIPEPVPPPETVRDFFDLDPFYQQWINVEGFPILASEKVNPYAVKEAAWLIWQMIGHRLDVLQALVQKRSRFSIIAHTELMTDIPEHSDFRPNFFYDGRQRGGGGLICSANEENLLQSGGGLYSVLIHEFAHTIHSPGLDSVDPTFDSRLKSVYNAAMEKGLWPETYAASNRDEYWAEGTQSWFNATQGNTVNTREALKTYDPDLAMLLTEVFGDSHWRYTLPAARTHLPHLRGFNPQAAPRFEWPPGVLEAYEELRDPNINERDEWVNLPPYDSSLISTLNESRNRGDLTDILFVNLSGAEVLLCWVYPDGKEDFANRFPPNPHLITQFGVEVGGLLLAKDSTGRNIAVFQAVEKVGRALVAPELNLITPGLSKVLGDNQASVSGAVLANPFVIEARDENLSVLKGISVTFTVTVGGGTLSVTHTTTDENGRAESTLTLGPNPGTNTVSGSAAGIEGTVTFKTTAEAAVAIPDLNLRAAVESALGKAKDDPITPSGMATLTHLEARNANINNLTGLEHATNLKSLSLDGEDVQGTWHNSNSVSNLSPLAGLTNLTELRLRDNNISDLSPLAGLINLTRLGVRDNNISDISPLTGLTNLTWLNLEFTSISNLPPLAGLTNLTDLLLYGNSISDLSPLAGLTNLATLTLTRNGLSDISALASLTNLTRLGLAQNNLSDISALAGLTNLETLGLAYNDISDISPLAGLINLTRVGLRSNSISDISPLAGLTNPARLDLRHNRLSDISSLVANTGLGSGDEFLIDSNPLSYSAINTHIPVLQSRGVTVEFDNRAHPALLKISGDNQNGASLAPLSQPFVVEAQDENGSALAGISVRFDVTAGGGTLSITITRTDTNGRVQSTLTLGPNLGTNTVEVSATGIQVPATFHAVSDRESPPITADVNNDGSVNVLDLVVIASELGNAGTNLVGDVNGDGVVNILDLIMVAGMFDGAAAAPSAQPQVPETLTAVEVQGWLVDARSLEIRDPIMKRGFVVLEQFLVSLTPKETKLLSNYPNPFNPETWIPYRLAEDAFVTLTIYDQTGHVVRTLDVGHRIASTYENRSKAIYWDGRNDVGEPVASGVYFYTLTAGDYSAIRRMVILK